MSAFMHACVVQLSQTLGAAELLQACTGPHLLSILSLRVRVPLLHEQNSGHLEYYFFLLAGIMAFCTAIFYLWARNYKYTTAKTILS